MEHEFKERRRSPRIATEHGTMAALHVSVPVRLVDVSPDGLLLACEAPMRIGSILRVVSGLAGRRLEVELCVRHVSSRRHEGVGGYVVGGSFPSPDPAVRHMIAALLSTNGLYPAAGPEPRLDRGRLVAPARGGVRRARPARRQDRPGPGPAPWISPARRGRSRDTIAP